MDAFSNVHRAVVQTVMTKGVMLESELEATLAKYAKKWGDEGRKYVLSRVVDEAINPVLRSLQFAIRTVVSERDGKRYCVFMNTGDDDLAQQCTGMKPELGKFMKGIMKQAIRAKGLVSEMHMRQLRPLGMSARAMHERLAEWCQSRWLAVAGPGMWTLGVRCVVELEGLLEEMGCPRCALCTEMVVMPESCDNCGVLFRKRCYASLKRCPKCSHQFTTGNPLARRGSDDNGGAGSGAGSGAGAGSGSGAAAEAEAEAEADSLSAPRRSTRSTRPSRRTRQRPEAADDDEDAPEPSPKRRRSSRRRS